MSDHAGISAPSPWIERFSPMIREGGTVLDLACGSGRHSSHLLARGHSVVALDLNVAAIKPLAERFGERKIEIIEADLEDGKDFPLKGRLFDGVVVTNYLYRPIMGHILASVKRGGLLLYETFAQGNERFGKPSNPDYLLLPGELLSYTAEEFRVLAYEDLVVDVPKPAAVQRIAARRH